MTPTSGSCPRSADDLSVPYGAKFITVIPDRPITRIHKDTGTSPLSRSEIVEKLSGDDLVMSPALSDIIAEGKRILVVLPDITRKSGAEAFIDHVMSLVVDSGADYSVMFAVGTHRPLTVEEKQTILTPSVFERVKDHIIDHDPDDMNGVAFYGTSRAKTTILVNKVYLEADTIITIAAVSYHYFAGFGGGRKMIIPGLAARKTAMMNHKLVLDVAKGARHEKATTGILAGNPVHDDLVDCVMITRAGKNFFAINTLLDETGRVLDIIAGDLFMGHIRATERLKEMTALAFDEPFDGMIVSCGGAPKDINMVQAQKSLDRVMPVVKPGAPVVFFAACPDGYGNKDFEEMFDLGDAAAMFTELVDDYRINRQTAYNLKRNLERNPVHIVTEFSEADCKRMGFTKISADDVFSVLKGAENVGYAASAYSLYLETAGD